MDRMADHDDEQRLTEIERELTAADPALAAALSSFSPVRRPMRWMALAVLGAAVLFGGFLLGSGTAVLLGACGAVAGSLMVTRATHGQEHDTGWHGYPPAWPQ